MRRREFIQCMLPLAGLPLVFPMWSVRSAFGATPRLRKFADLPDDGRVLVLVQLAGGNDGLNTVIPYQNDLYYSNRPRLAIDRNTILPLDSDTGLHPSLAPIKSLYDAGNVAIVQGVGYPNPNRSHFKSTDIWLTASNANDLQDTGWLGRYFDVVCPPDENGQVTCGTLGPPAIQIGLTSSLALLGKNPRGIALQDPLAFYNLVAHLGDPHGGNQTVEPKTAAERELFFLRETAASAFEYAGDILQAFDKAGNTVAYPDESLAAQLAIVARLIAGGLSTRVYIVSIKGFDTHANQPGTHNSLLAAVARAIAAFQADLANLGLADRVLGVCFSEFGRRVRENGSLGTDHGTAAPMLLFGRPANGGLYGAPPDLADLDNGDLKHQFDFRQVYASLLEQWLGTTSSTILGANFGQITLVQQTTAAPQSTNHPADFYLLQNYPNPFNPTTTIEYGLPQTTEIELAVFSSLGRRVAVLAKGRQHAGVHRVVWSANGLASGTYYLRLRGRGVYLNRSMQLVK